MTAERKACGCLPSGPAMMGAATGGGVAGTASPAWRASLMAGMRFNPGGFLDTGASRWRYAIDPDAPRRRVKLSSFALAATSVTNRQFAAFVAESGYRKMADREHR